MDCGVELALIVHYGTRFLGLVHSNTDCSVEQCYAKPTDVLLLR